LPVGRLPRRLAAHEVADVPKEVGQTLRHGAGSPRWMPHLSLYVAGEGRANTFFARTAQLIDSPSSLVYTRASQRAASCCPVLPDRLLQSCYLGCCSPLVN
jgi:hypothetical protein